MFWEGANDDAALVLVVREVALRFYPHLSSTPFLREVRLAVRPKKHVHFAQLF